MERLEPLVAASLQGGAFVLAAYGLARAFSRVPARYRAWLWWAACLKMSLVALGAFVLTLPILPAPSSVAGLSADTLPLPGPEATGVTSVAGESLARTGPTLPGPSALPFAIWLLGVAGIVLVLAVQAGRLAGVVRRARPLPQGPAAEEARRLGVAMGLARRPDVRLSDEVSAPMVVMPWRPTVVLPEAFAADAEPDELRLALAHELAHIRRGDLWTVAVPALAQALLWFNPFVWLAAREWATEREAACDADALLATGGSPAEYGRLLVKIVADDHRGGLAPVLGATAAYHTLKRRLSIMKSHAPHASFPRRFVGAAIAALALLAALPWRVTAQTPPPAKEKNLLTNAGFESGLADWSRRETISDQPIGIDAAIDDAEHHSGAKSLRFRKSKATFFPVLAYNQPIPMTARTRRLKVGMWVKAEKARKATLAVIFDEERIEWGGYVGEANAGDGPADHDWRYYNAVLDVPATTRELSLAVQMYGSGNVWIDDVSASFVPDATPLKAGVSETSEDPLADVRDVPMEERKAGNDPYKRYFLIGKPTTTPSKLLVVLPGGDGSDAFTPFVRRVWKNALPPGYLVAEAVAPKWSPDQFDSVVWPTRKYRWATMRFTTEEFVEAIVKDVAAKAGVDPKGVFVMGWSSGGPSTYTAAMTLPSVHGALVLSSVYYPAQMPAPSGGRGRPFYLLQSPDDPITTYGNALTAKKELASGGAKVTLVNLSGGHGFGTEPFVSVRKGVEWLEANRE